MKESWKLVHAARNYGFGFDEVNFSAIGIPYPKGEGVKLAHDLPEHLKLPQVQSTVVALPDYDYVIAWIPGKE